MFREKWIIFISLGIGLAAACFFYFYSGGRILHGRKQAGEIAPMASATKPCVIVVKDAPRRTILTKDMLSVVNVPIGLAHPMAVASVKNAEGRVTNDRLLKGQFVLEPNLRDKDAPSELEFALPKNMRAITIAATVTNAVGNMLQPGDYVDIIIFLNSQVAGENVSFTLLRNVQILATDTQLDNEKEKSGISKVTGSVENAKGYQSVTLAVSSTDCVKLNLAESVGQIKLALHSTQEQKIAASDGKEIAVTGDLTKEFGFKIAKSNSETAPPQASAKPAGANEPALAKSNSVKQAGAAKPREPVKVVYIMRGSKIEIMAAASGEPGNIASGKGETHEN